MRITVLKIGMPLFLATAAFAGGVARAEVPKSPAEAKSLIVFCLPFEVIGAEKKKGEDDQIRAVGAKRAVGFGIAIDRGFPHSSAELFDPENAFPNVAIEHVGGNPPNIEVVGRLGSNQSVHFNLGMSNIKERDSTISIMVRNESGLTQTWAGTCFWQPRTEPFDGLDAEFSKLNAEWKAADTQ